MGGPPPGGGGPDDEPAEPGGAEGGGTHTPQDTFTRYDEEKDAYHCSYGPPSAALAVWDPERELIVRLDRNTKAVVGFSIPNFTAWHAKHADEDGTFEIDLPPTYDVDDGAAGS
jgi:hypothetical protein